ncbi:hypothetical protein BKA70DRAFT_95195 [Coprinopsis sp. MPI-PUGE-AT-0042]|nr:hypothetical protein BKA70DRAFT_95195 [Coprinopsis sp. MPI-PUGE-AT-0042]
MMTFIIQLVFQVTVDNGNEAIMAKDAERTQELNCKYEQLNLEDLSNFKSAASGRVKTSKASSANRSSSTPPLFPPESARIQARLEKGEARRPKCQPREPPHREDRVCGMRGKSSSLTIRQPGAVSTDYWEEDRHLICRLDRCGMKVDVYEKTKRDISKFPVFQFDWFFKSHSPQELQQMYNPPFPGRGGQTGQVGRGQYEWNKGQEARYRRF